MNMNDTRAMVTICAMAAVVGAVLVGCDSDDDDDGTTTQSTSSSSGAGASTSSSSSSSSASTGTGATGGGGAGATGGTGGTGGAPTGGAGGTGGDSSGGAGGTGGTGGGSGAQLVINEVTHSPAGDAEDWLEFYNAGDAAADLTDWYFTDSDPTHVFTFAAGTMVLPGAYLVLTQNDADSFDFGFGGGGDEVNLYDGQDTLVDATIWLDGEGAEPGSWGRSPNGSGNFTSLLTVTPGAANP
jgi:hypothetical protein